MEEKERYDVKRLSYSLNVKLTDNYEPDWRYIIFDDVNDAELAKLETVCNLLNQQDKRIKELEQENQQLKEAQKQLAIEELVKLLNSFDFYENEDGNTLVSAKYVLSIFDYIGIRIKELGGGENE